MCGSSRAMLELDSTLRHNSTASTEKLDSPRQPSTATRRAGAWSQPRQARQELDRNSTGSTRLDRQGLDNGLDSGSTEPRQSLDSSTARQPGLNISAQLLQTSGGRAHEGLINEVNVCGRRGGSAAVSRSRAQAAGRLQRPPPGARGARPLTAA
jgi:hypothetical protein